MPDISMTTFVDFAVGTGSTRLTVVRNAIKQAGEVYDPASDYYRQLRKGIQDQFRSGWEGSASIKALRRVTPNPKRVENYGLCVDGLEKWTKRKTFGHSRSHARVWSAYGLNVRVNPELLLTVDGSPTLVKLYFKSEKLSKTSTRTMLHLLAAAHPTATPTILDLRRGTLVTPGAQLAQMDVLLNAEAAQFSAMWTELGGP